MAKNINLNLLTDEQLVSRIEAITCALWKFQSGHPLHTYWKKLYDEAVEERARRDDG